MSRRPDVSLRARTEDDPGDGDVGAHDVVQDQEPQRQHRPRAARATRGRLQPGQGPCAADAEDGAEDDVTRGQGLMEQQPHDEQEHLPDVILGANDGVITTLAVVAGVAGASLSPAVLLILGFANLLADGFSMGASDVLSRRSDPQSDELPALAAATSHGLATFLGFVVAGFVPVLAYLLLARVALRSGGPSLARDPFCCRSRSRVFCQAQLDRLRAGDAAAECPRGRSCLRRGSHWCDGR
jgi:hypothetical protein